MDPLQRAPNTISGSPTPSQPPSRSASAASPSYLTRLLLPLLTIYLALGSQNLIESRIGSPMPDQVGEVRFTRVADGSAGQFVRDHLIEALLTLCGFLPKQTIHLSRYTSNCVFRGFCLQSHAFMLPESVGRPAPERTLTK